VQGASQAQEVRNRKASPEGSGEKAEAQAEVFKTGLEGTGRMEARKGTIRERETRQVEVRAQAQASTITGTPRQDREAGSRAARGASRTQAGAGERADSLWAQARTGSRARWSTGRWELAAARGEGRKAEQSAEAQAKGRLPEGWGNNQHEGQSEQQAQAGGDGGPKACQRAASERRRRGES